MMIDIDGEVVEACKKHLPEVHQKHFDEPRVELVIADALKVLDTTDETLDIIISDLSDPIESAMDFHSDLHYVLIQLLILNHSQNW